MAPLGFCPVHLVSTRPAGLNRLFLLLVRGLRLVLARTERAPSPRAYEHTNSFPRSLALVFAPCRGKNVT